MARELLENIIDKMLKEWKFIPINKVDSNKALSKSEIWMLRGYKVPNHDQAGKVIFETLFQYAKCDGVKFYVNTVPKLSHNEHVDVLAVNLQHNDCIMYKIKIQTTFLEQNGQGKMLWLIDCDHLSGTYDALVVVLYKFNTLIDFNDNIWDYVEAVVLLSTKALISIRDYLAITKSHLEKRKITIEKTENKNYWVCGLKNLNEAVIFTNQSYSSAILDSFNQLLSRLTLDSRYPSLAEEKVKQEINERLATSLEENKFQLRLEQCFNAISDKESDKKEKLERFDKLASAFGANHNRREALSYLLSAIPDKVVESLINCTLDAIDLKYIPNEDTVLCNNITLHEFFVVYLIYCEENFPSVRRDKPNANSQDTKQEDLTSNATWKPLILAKVGKTGFQIAFIADPEKELREISVLYSQEKIDRFRVDNHETLQAIILRAAKGAMNSKKARPIQIVKQFEKDIDTKCHIQYFIVEGNKGCHVQTTAATVEIRVRESLSMPRRPLHKSVFERICGTKPSTIKLIAPEEWIITSANIIQRLNNKLNDKNRSISLKSCSDFFSSILEPDDEKDREIIRHQISDRRYDIKICFRKWKYTIPEGKKNRTSITPKELLEEDHVLVKYKGY